MALQSMEEVVAEFKAEGDWHLAQTAELYVAQRVLPGAVKGW